MKTMKSIKLAITAVLMTVAPLVQAAVVPAQGTVTVIITYAEFGGGDFTFRLSSHPTGCQHGFWATPNQPGFKTIVAYILKAHATGEPVLVGGNDALMWSGSGGQYCKVDYVGTPY